MNYVRVLSFLPYPYKFTLQSHMMAQQATHGAILRGGSWSLLLGSPYKRSFFTNYYLRGVAHLALRHFLWSRLSDLCLRLGVVSPNTPPSSVAQDAIADQLRLLQLRYDIDTLTQERDRATSLFAHAEGDDSEEEAAISDMQAHLDRLGHELAQLYEEKSLLKDRIRRKREKDVRARREETEPTTHSLVSDGVAEWIIGNLANVLSEALLYPLFLAEVWMMVPQQDTTWPHALSNLWSAARQQNKSLYDGFLPHALYTVLRGFTMHPLMKVLKHSWSIPTEPQLQRHMLQLMSLFLVDEGYTEEGEEGETLIYEPSPAERKRELVTAFRAVMKNTAAYMVADWVSQALFFPLLTCRNFMAAQGSTYLAPRRGLGWGGAIRHIVRSQGYQGFYRGFLAHCISIVPELMAWGVFYVGVSIWFEYRLSEEEEDELEPLPSNSLSTPEEEDDVLTSS